MISENFTCDKMNVRVIQLFVYLFWFKLLDIVICNLLDAHTGGKTDNINRSSCEHNKVECGLR